MHRTALANDVPSQNKRPEWILCSLGTMLFQVPLKAVFGITSFSSNMISQGSLSWWKSINGILTSNPSTDHHRKLLMLSCSKESQLSAYWTCVRTQTGKLRGIWLTPSAHFTCHRRISLVDKHFLNDQSSVNSVSLHQAPYFTNIL